MDGRPHFDGEALCKTLLARGVRCTYMHLNAIAFVMDSVTKVLLGASAVKSNGAVLARSGTAVVAMAAHNARKPVLICAQSIKFHEAVQLDSITSNEQGNSQARCCPPFSTHLLAQHLITLASCGSQSKPILEQRAHLHLLLALSACDVLVGCQSSQVVGMQRQSCCLKAPC